jgi:hypothetical protein
MRTVTHSPVDFQTDLFVDRVPQRRDSGRGSRPIGYRALTRTHWEML